MRTTVNFPPLRPKYWKEEAMSAIPVNKPVDPKPTRPASQPAANDERIAQPTRVPKAKQARQRPLWKDGIWFI